MSSSNSVSYHQSSRSPTHYSERVENFFRTSENFVQRSSPGASMLSSLGRFGLLPDSNFELFVEVPHYKPEEVTVTTQEDLLIVMGKHEENHPENGYQSREFTNKYTLPKNVDKSKMNCVFKSQGYLRIEAPYVKPEDPNARTIPIKVLSEPAKVVSTTINGTSGSSFSTSSTTVKTASNSSVTTNGTSVSHV